MLHLIDLEKFVPFGHYLVIIHGDILGRVCLLQRFLQLIIKVDSLLVKTLLLVLSPNC